MPYFYHCKIDVVTFLFLFFCKKDHNSAKFYPSKILASFYFQILLKSLVLLILNLGIIDILYCIIIQCIPSWLEVYMLCFPWFPLQWWIKFHVVTRCSAPDTVHGEGRLNWRTDWLISLAYNKSTSYNHCYIGISFIK